MTHYRSKDNPSNDGRYPIPEPAGIPETFRQLPRWSVWWAELRERTGRNGSTLRTQSFGVPDLIKAHRAGLPPELPGPHSPLSWASLAETLPYYRAFVDRLQDTHRAPTCGVGISLPPGSPFTTLSLLNAWDRDAKEVRPWARPIVELLASYTEISPTGLGLTIVVHGRRGSPSGDCDRPLGAYDHDSRSYHKIRYRDGPLYLRLTGHRLSSSPADVTSIEPGWLRLMTTNPRTGQDRRWFDLSQLKEIARRRPQTRPDRRAEVLAWSNGAKAETSKLQHDRLERQAQEEAVASKARQEGNRKAIESLGGPTPPPALPEHELAAERERAAAAHKEARAADRAAGRTCPRSITVEATEIRTGDPVFLETNCDGYDCPVCHDHHVRQKCCFARGVLHNVRPESLRGNGVPDGCLWWTEIGYLSDHRWQTMRDRMRKSARSRGQRQASYMSVSYFGRLFLVSTDRPCDDSVPVARKEAAARYAAAAESIPVDRAVRRPFAKASKDWRPPNPRPKDAPRIFRRRGRSSATFDESMAAAKRLGAAGEKITRCEPQINKKVPIRIGTFRNLWHLPWVRDGMTKAEIVDELFARVQAEAMGMPYDLDDAPGVLGNLFGGREQDDAIEAGILSLATKT